METGAAGGEEELQMAGTLAWEQPGDDLAHRNIRVDVTAEL